MASRTDIRAQDPTGVDRLRWVRERVDPVTARARDLYAWACVRQPWPALITRDRLGSDGVFLLAGVLVLALAWSRLAFDNVSLLVFQDASEQTYAWWQYSVTELQSGRFPLWDPYTFAGRTNVGEGQEGVFYPPFLSLVLLAGQWAGSIAAIQLFAFLHAVLAFGGAYLLARVLGMRRLAGLGCGLTYALGGFFSQRALGQLNIFDATAWVPLVVVGPFLVARTRQVRWGLLSGAALALSLLAGHAQPALHAAMVLGLALMFLCCVPLRSNCAALGARRGWLTLVLAGGSAACFAAVQLLPTLEYQPLALRWVGDDEPIAANARIPLAIAASNPALDLRLLPSVLLQNTPIPDGALYIGAAALACVGAGSFLHTSRARFFWIFLLGFGVVLSLGTVTPLFGFVFQLPLVNQIREPVRYLLLVHLSLAILTGFGLDYLVRKAPLVVPVGLLMIASAQMGLVWSSSLPPRMGYDGVNNREVQRYYSTVEADGLAEFLAAQPGLFRIDLTDSPLPRNYGELLRIPTVGGYRATSPTNIQRFRERVGFLPPDRGPDLLGIRYLVSSKPLRGIDEVAQVGSVHIYQNPRAFPLAWIVSDLRVVEDDDQALAEVASNDFDAANAAVVEDEQAKQLAGLEPSPTRAAVITEYLPSTVRITTQASGAALLVMSQADYPGWVASVDGHEVHPVTVDYAFLGVPVPQGQHAVELDYRPGSVIVGAIITIAASLASLGALTWFVLDFVRRRTLPLG